MASDPVPAASSSETMAKIVYVLYLASIVVGLSSIIGVIIAYVHRQDAPDWLRTHYQFQIRTFWIGSLYLFLGVLLSMVVVGVLLIVFWVIWLVIRSVKGLKALDSRAPIADVQTWLF